VVEEDGDAGRSYVYLFSGQLGRAGIGLPDVRRIAAQNQGFHMAFDAPRARYGDDEVPSRGAPATLSVGADMIELSRLDDAGLTQSGARRWLGSTASGDFDVRAYFGVLRRAAPLTEMTIEVGDDELTFVPELAPAMPTAVVEQALLRVSFLRADRVELDPLRADHLVVDLWQAITPAGSADDDAGVPATETEAIVRLMLATQSTYEAVAALVTDAAGKGCWSASEPLSVRVDQVYRRYLERRDGDLAIIHHRLDGTRVAPASWSPLLLDPKPASYCDGFE
jgi:hypothetical protein